MAEYSKNHIFNSKFWEIQEVNQMDFSIVTIVYNDVSHIKETMNSVVEQSHKKIEYILIDGASTDGTKEAILEYLFRLEI